MLRDLLGRARRSALILAAVLSCAAQCHAAPLVHLSRASVDFGALGFQSISSVQPVFVSNTGDAPLTISAVTLGGPQSGSFVIAGTCAPPITIAPGGQCRIDATATLSGFVPQVQVAIVSLASNATPPSTAFSLLVTAVGDIRLGMVPSPPWIDFGNQTAGTSAAHQPLVLRNSEQTTEVIESVVLLAGDAQDFTVASDCVGQTSGRGSTCTATIGFTPSAAGPRSTELQITYHPTTVPTLHLSRFYSITGVGTNSSSPGTLNIDQQGLTGSWYQAATSGQGFEIEVFKDVAGAGSGLLQGSWFTFDATTSGGADHGRWYTFGGAVHAGTNSASLPLYQNLGGNFNALPVTSATPVGNVTITFTNCSTAQYDYIFTDGSNRSGTVPLTRLLPNVLCATADSAPGPSDFGLSGNWYDPAKSGQGLVFEVNPVAKFAFFAWYTYSVAGQAQGASGQRWFTGQASYTPGARSIMVTLYETTGGLLNSATPAPSTVQVGTGTLAFSSCNAARLTYAFASGSVSGQSGFIDLVRAGPVPASCAF
jgi:hypothetical protein